MGINKIQLFAFMLLTSGFVFANAPGDPACQNPGGSTDPTSQLLEAMQNLCSALNGLVPVAAMLMVMFASVVYATGQMMGAETRARANVWATSALTGALIGILISVIAPAILGVIADKAIDCT